MGQVLQNFQNKDEDKDDVDKIFPFGTNDKLGKIAQKFQLKGKSFIQFHFIFRTMDKQGSGYITVENLFEFLEEEMTSVLSPYIHRLFQLIQKETPDKISFVEWLPAICVYCLYPNERIIQFVFSMIDDDHDKIISKKDMIKFLVAERHGQTIFPFNYVRAIELLEVRRSDMIDFEDFKKEQSKIPFLCYPAFRLQGTLRNKILGQEFWEQLYVKIKEQETKDKTEQQIKQIHEENLQKQNDKTKMKTLKFDNIFKTKKIKQNLIIETIRENQRQPKEELSDEILFLFDKPFNDLQQEVIKKQQRSKSLVYIKESKMIQDKHIDNRKQENSGSEDEKYISLKQSKIKNKQNQAKISVNKKSKKLKSTLKNK